ncbi:hypothetical protein [Trinickia mobilis]|uniref:hypothetical protein n=1 Tax=Trinickia mobilis TaxID=2816356 RepID=UPI001A8EA3D0|nr:hypothetical protein [Trinickia mobilis]
MSKNNKPWGWRASSIVTALLAAALVAGCGGGRDITSATIVDASSSINSQSFFDSVFLTGVGEGYFQFDAVMDPTTGRPTAAGRTEYSVSGETDENFKPRDTVVAGEFGQSMMIQVYIAADGAVESTSSAYTNMGSSSRIFKRMPQGYQLGMEGLPSPLYDVTLTPVDVSGQAVGAVISKDSGSATNGLSILLASGTAPMPKGARIFQVSENVLTTHLWFRLSWMGSGWPSLEAAQAANGGTIRTLGGYRYLDGGAKQGVYIEYKGVVHSGQLFNAGETHAALPGAYNRIAAEFIAQEEQTAMQAH